MWRTSSKKTFIPLNKINIEEELSKNDVFNDYKNKDEWVRSLTRRIIW
jgi:hypothetical protein